MLDALGTSKNGNIITAMLQVFPLQNYLFSYYYDMNKRYVVRITYILHFVIFVYKTK